MRFFSMRFISAFALCSLFALGLTGCGQKGPLVMPSEQTATQSAA